MSRLPPLCLLAAAALISLESSASAAVTAVVHVHTSDAYAISFSGTFDQDVGGDQTEWLALKSAWSTNQGTNTEWLLGYTGPAIAIAQGPFTVLENSVTIDGFAPTETNASGADPWGDTLYFDAGFPILAGMAISGTLHVQAVGMFDPTVSAPDLLAGFDNITLDWHELVTNTAIGPLLTIGGSCNGPGTVDIIGLSPGGDFAAVRGGNLYGATVPGGACFGTALDVGNPALIGITTADVNGAFSAAPNLPPTLCGQFVQLVDLTSCVVSNIQGPF